MQTSDYMALMQRDDGTLGSAELIAAYERGIDGRFQPLTAPKAAKQTFLWRTSTCANPTWRSRSSWNSSGRGVSSRST